MKHIFLCGFMGCGKTTVGQLLGDRLTREYLDLDDEIERIAGASIPELFARFGEGYFRDREQEALLGLAGRSGLVVATGGGTVTFPRNLLAFAEDDLCVFLDTPFELCWARIYGSSRPLVRSHSAQELHTLFLQRQKAYRTAAHIALDGTLPADQLVEMIAALTSGRKQSQLSE